MRMEETFLCPYCGSENSLLVDYSEGKKQEFVLDCETCCRPIVVKITFHSSEAPEIQTEKENG